MGFMEQQQDQTHATDNISALDNESRASRPWLAVWPVVALAILVGLIFSDHLVWLVKRWWNSEYYGHGFLIPIISGYLIYRKREQIRELPRAGFYGGIVVILASLALHYVATYVDVHFPSGFALIGVLMGLTWLLWGWPVFKEVAFPLVFLFFMVPLGKLLVNQVAQPMQMFSASMAGGVAQFLGMPVTIEGTRLAMPEYTFEVAIACSGLKSIITMTALGALLAYIIRASLWKKLLVFASSLPAAIVANAARIWLTLVLGRALGEKAAEGFFHTFSGILVFLLALLGLLGVTTLLKCRQLREDI